MTNSNHTFIAQARYQNARKSVGVAYLLWFLAGWFGAHRFYAGAGETGAAFLVLFVFGIGAVAAGSAWGFALLLAWFVWFIADLFLIPGMIEAYNDKLLEDLK